MIKLNLPREPHWIKLAAGVRLQVRPATTALVMAARHAASKIAGTDTAAAGERTATSNVNGLVQFTNLIPGWRYAVVANDDYVADFVVPADAVTSVELGSIVARLP